MNRVGRAEQRRSRQMLGGREGQLRGAPDAAVPPVFWRTVYRIATVKV